MPADIRHKMGVSNQGDKLQYVFDEDKNEMTIKKGNFDWESIHEITRPYTKGKKPVMNVDEYYQKHRKVTWRAL